MARTARNATTATSGAGAVPAGRSGGSSTGLRLTRRGRAFVLGGALSLVVGLGLGGVGALSAQAGQPGVAVALAEHVVAPGETLWHIASSATPAGRDVRDTVAELQRINGLQGSHLMIGQQILVPAR